MYVCAVCSNPARISQVIIYGCDTLQVSTLQTYHHVGKLLSSSSTFSLFSSTSLPSFSLFFYNFNMHNKKRKLKIYISTTYTGYVVNYIEKVHKVSMVTWGHWALIKKKKKKILWKKPSVDFTLPLLLIMCG